MKYDKIKRVIDFLVAFLAIICLSPIFAIIALAVKLDSDGPIIFKQKRYGIHNKQFTIYKFRTMRVDTPENCATRELKNRNYYVTKVGHILRKTSLDEIPQLFNVLKGNMRIIGPRPVVIAETDLIKEREKYGVNDLPPGLTGYAQINGRDELDAKEKARLDYYYKTHASLLLDLSILFKTFIVVLKREGIKAKDEKTTSDSTHGRYVLINNENLVNSHMSENNKKYDPAAHQIAK